MNEKLNIKGNIIFIHIPKNAGTSISLSLGLENSCHSTALEIRNELGYKDFQGFFKFAVIRNPLSRFISLYNYARMDESYYHSSVNPKQAKYGKHQDYDILKDASLEQCALLLINGKLRHDKHWNQWKPQTTWICDEQENILIDFLIRFENLSSDFKTLRSKLDISNNLFDVNKSEVKKEDKVHVSSTVKEIISDYYASDFKLLKYSLE